jgi:phosphotransferase system enzyme I (PtsI)
MDIKRGIAVSPGVAIGPALVLDTEGVVISQRFVTADRVEDEVRRLGDALARVAADARARERAVTERLGQDIGNIFHGHAGLMEDEGQRRKVEDLIRSQLYTAEYAVSRHVRSIVKKFEELPPDSQFAHLRHDFLDLERQVLAHLMGVPGAGPLPLVGESVIVLAHDLTPSETAQLDPNTVHAFATESGGPTSHTAIMAGALEIPAVVGIGRFLSDVSGGDTVIVDGTQGLLIIDPDELTLARYQALRQAQSAAPTPDLESIRQAPSATRDGVHITLLGNIEFPSEAAPCLERGAEGVVLYRTEYLYVNKTDDPTENEHYEAYRQVLTALGPGHPVVIRTLDIGADKFSSVTGLLSGEKNPFLGLRSVRLCLQNLDLFKTQLRAILRASVHGDVRIMFPMISTVMELRQCKIILAEVREDLEEAGMPFKPDIPIGTMIEVPSAALMADVLAREVDFFSIGTNDLVQYTLAADRNNEHVAGLYNAADPAVLRLIRLVCDAGRRQEIAVNVCGEMSGEPMYAPLLIGLGIRQLSATPRKIPEIKRVIRSLAVADAERIAQEADRMVTAAEVTRYLREQLRRILPDAAD